MDQRTTPADFAAIEPEASPRPKEEIVQESSEESFPASDPPAWAGGRVESAVAGEAARATPPSQATPADSGAQGRRGCRRR